MNKTYAIFCVLCIMATFSIGCLEKDHESQHYVHLWVTNQRFQQYSNISVKVDSNYYFNVTAISGNGHTYYYDNLSLSSGNHIIKVHENDTNTKLIVDIQTMEQFINFKIEVDQEIWIVVSFWNENEDIPSPFFQVKTYDEAPGIT